jgi:hypothetical protein
MDDTELDAFDNSRFITPGEARDVDDTVVGVTKYAAGDRTVKEGESIELAAPSNAKLLLLLCRFNFCCWFLTRSNFVRFSVRNRMSDSKHDESGVLRPWEEGLGNAGHTCANRIHLPASAVFTEVELVNMVALDSDRSFFVIFGVIVIGTWKLMVLRMSSEIMDGKR